MTKEMCKSRKKNMEMSVRKIHRIHLYMKVGLMYIIRMTGEEDTSTEMMKDIVREGTETPAEVAGVVRSIEVVNAVESKIEDAQNTAETEMMVVVETNIENIVIGQKIVTKERREKRHVKTVTMILRTSQNIVPMKTKKALEHVVTYKLTVCFAWNVPNTVLGTLDLPS